MVDTDTIMVSRAEYDALVSRNEELEDRLLAMEAEDGSRIPHEVAVLVMDGMSPLAAFRKHLGVSLRGLSDKTWISRSYLSEIERGHKPGSAATLSRIAKELGTNIDTLIM